MQHGTGVSLERLGVKQFGYDDIAEHTKKRIVECLGKAGIFDQSGKSGLLSIEMTFSLSERGSTTVRDVLMGSDKNVASGTVYRLREKAPYPLIHWHINSKYGVVRGVDISSKTTVDWQDGSQPLIWNHSGGWELLNPKQRDVIDRSVDIHIGLMLSCIAAQGVECDRIIPVVAELLPPTDPEKWYKKLGNGWKVKYNPGPAPRYSACQVLSELITRCGKATVADIISGVKGIAREELECALNSSQGRLVPDPFAPATSMNSVGVTAIVDSIDPAKAGPRFASGISLADVDIRVAITSLCRACGTDFRISEDIGSDSRVSVRVQAGVTLDDVLAVVESSANVSHTVEDGVYIFRVRSQDAKP